MSRNSNGPTLEAQDRAVTIPMVLDHARHEPKPLRRVYVVRWWHPIDRTWRSQRYVSREAAQRQVEWARKYYRSDIVVDESIVTETRRTYLAADGRRDTAVIS